MNLTLLIERWKEKMQGRSLVEQAVYNECISDITMLANGEIKEPYKLDSRWPMKKHKGKTVQEVIEQDPAYVDWCLAQSFLSWFSLDQIAFNYLVEVQEGDKDKYNDIGYGTYSDFYNDLKRGNDE